MTKAFSIDTTIGYFGTDERLNLTPASIALYLQDIAIRHSDSIGYTINYLTNLHRGWAITNCHYLISRYPKYGEKITISTWADSCKRKQAQRSFHILDQNQNPIIVAQSRWIFMDLLNRRPTIVPDEMQEAFSCDLKSAIPDEKFTMPKADETYLFSQRLFRVERRDTDSNGHANNTKYLEWACDDVPDEIYSQYRPMDMRIVYRKECYHRSFVLSKCYIRKENDKIETIFLFLDGKDRKTVYSEISMVWSKQEDTLSSLQSADTN